MFTLIPVSFQAVYHEYYPTTEFMLKLIGTFYQSNKIPALSSNLKNVGCAPLMDLSCGQSCFPASHFTRSTFTHFVCFFVRLTGDGWEKNPFDSDSHLVVVKCK